MIVLTFLFSSIISEMNQRARPNLLLVEVLQTKLFSIQSPSLQLTPVNQVLERPVSRKEACLLMNICIGFVLQHC
nr:hypothetical protein CFP56_01604 [Quercus suber]